MKPCGVRILGTGSAVPEYILDNDELAKEHGVDAAWIEQRTGIVERRICSESEGTFELQCQALKNALADTSKTHWLTPTNHSQTTKTRWPTLKTLWRTPKLIG